MNSVYTSSSAPVDRFMSTSANSLAPPPSNYFALPRHRPSLSLRTITHARYTRCLSASQGPPSPPDSEPPRPPGDPGTFSTIQESIRIFFAVLFWMSLFFWASAWDGRNSNRPMNGSRFKR